MRVDAYSKVNQVYQTASINKNKASSKTFKNDKIELSTQGQDYQLAKKAIAETPDIREDVVASLKSRISSGTYEVCVEDFAAKLVQDCE